MNEPDQPLRITALEPVRRHPDRVHLCVDGERRCTVAYDVAAVEQLHPGRSIAGDLLDRLIRLDALWQAQNAALALLAVRPRARRELVNRLRRKGHDEAGIEAALRNLERLGYIDDAAFAQAWVRDRLRLRPRGVRGLVAELLRMGVTQDTAHAAVTSVMTDARVSEHGLCEAAAAKWLQTHPLTPGDRGRTRRLEQRLRGYLARRGFAPAAIAAAMIMARATQEGHEP